MTTARSDVPRFRGAPVDVVVDVRSKLEFWMGHLPGAICVPLERIPGALTARAGITEDSRILVYCAAGSRSAAAVAALRAAGFKHVIDGGGMATASPDYSAG